MARKKKEPTLPAPIGSAPAPAVKKARKGKAAGNFKQWRKEGGRWLHYSGDSAVSEKRLITKNLVKGVCKEFPEGQLMAMEADRRDDFLNAARLEDAKSKSPMFLRPEDSDE